MTEETEMNQMPAADNACDNGRDTIRAIYDEAIEVFRFDKDLRPQDRAHKYLEEHKVSRGYSDTALQVCVLDLIKRSYLVGSRDAFTQNLELEEKAAMLTEVSADLLRAAIALRGVSVEQPAVSMPVSLANPEE